MAGPGQPLSAQQSQYLAALEALMRERAAQRGRAWPAAGLRDDGEAEEGFPAAGRLRSLAECWSMVLGAGDCEPPGESEGIRKSHYIDSDIGYGAIASDALNRPPMHAALCRSRPFGRRGSSPELDAGRCDFGPAGATRHAGARNPGRQLSATPSDSDAAAPPSQAGADGGQGAVRSLNRAHSDGHMSIGGGSAIERSPSAQDYGARSPSPTCSAAGAAAAPARSRPPPHPG